VSRPGVHHFFILFVLSSPHNRGQGKILEPFDGAPFFFFAGLFRYETYFPDRKETDY
jgi:hypothetical protein